MHMHAVGLVAGMEKAASRDQTSWMKENESGQGLDALSNAPVIKEPLLPSICSQRWKAGVCSRPRGCQAPSVKDQITNALWTDGFCQRCSAVFVIQKQPKRISTAEEGTWLSSNRPDV